MNTISLNNDTQIPQVALGLWKVQDKDELETAVTTALDAGYTHFDSAQVYENEEMLGEVINKSDVARGDVFITTKIWNDNQPEGKFMPSFEQSLKNLQTDYVDLLLLHFPVTETRTEAWKMMEQVYESGKAKAIGVSNYTVRHLEELLANCSVKPAVNQVELHVYLQQPELVDYCKAQGITLEAYSPLAHGKELDNKVLQEIADKHGKSTAQIMIRWCIDSDMVVLPKSVTPERIRQNIDLFNFKLDEEDMVKLKGLDKGMRTAWDPSDAA